ncbi:MAG: DeoR/GlpR family DNA-binding transcription regulator [Mangrovibacterium sp.]
MSMITSQRHKYILEKVAKKGFVTVSELSDELNVSTVTIRKDLKVLEERKLLYKTHGGASVSDPYINDRPVDMKEGIEVEQKELIAKKAAELIIPNDSIIIASGTTVLALAKALNPERSLTVLTSAMNVSLALLPHQNIEVVQLGGSVRRTSSSVVGHYAENMLQNFACSKLFLGVDGIDLDFGLTTTNLMEAQLNQQMMKIAQKVVVIADATKFGKKGFGKICDLDKVDIIITDKRIPDHFVTKIEELGIQLLIV